MVKSEVNEYCRRSYKYLTVGNFELIENNFKVVTKEHCIWFWSEVWRVQNRRQLCLSKNKRKTQIKP